LLPEYSGDGQTSHVNVDGMISTESIQFHVLLPYTFNWKYAISHH